MRGNFSQFIILTSLLYNQNWLSIYYSLISFDSRPRMKQVQYADEYGILTQIGDGGQAIVYLGVKTYQLYAIKVYLPGQQKLQAFKKEVQCLQTLKHKNLINMVGWKQQAKVKVQGQKEQIRPIVILQYASGGELYELVKNGKGLKPEHCRTIFKQIIQGLSYLESRGISHRDIKPENILFDSDYNIKITDFGLSTKVDGDFLTSKVGTQGYQAPQIRSGKYQGAEVDIFAAGVTLFIMYNQGRPFECTYKANSIYKYIKDKNFGKFWFNHEKKKPQGFFSSSFKHLLNELFSFQPSQRPSFTSLMLSEWMNECSCSEEELKKELRLRFMKILENDPEKKKIELLKRQVEEMGKDHNVSSSSVFAKVEGQQISLQ